MRKGFVAFFVVGVAVVVVIVAVVAVVVAVVVTGGFAATVVNS